MTDQIFGFTPETPEHGLPGYVAARRSPAGGVTLIVREHGAEDPDLVESYLPSFQLAPLADALAAQHVRDVADMDDPLLQFFAFEHLPPHLQAVSRPFGLLARRLVAELRRNPERTVALRKLLEAKDCAVRALLWRDA